MQHITRWKRKERFRTPFVGKGKDSVFQNFHRKKENAVIRRGSTAAAIQKESIFRWPGRKVDWMKKKGKKAVFH